MRYYNVVNYERDLPASKKTWPLIWVIMSTTVGDQ